MPRPVLEEKRMAEKTRLQRLPAGIEENKPYSETSTYLIKARNDALPSVRADLVTQYPCKDKGVYIGF